MKKRLIGACFAIVFAAPAHAESDVEGNATTRVKWQGGITWLSRVGTCSSWNPVNEHAIARFRPSDLGTNGSYSNLTVFYSTYALGFRVLGRFTSAYKTVDAQDIGSGMGTWQPKVRFVTQVPATLTATTKQLVVTGQIQGFDYTPTCTVNFSMVLQRDYRD